MAGIDKRWINSIGDVQTDRILDCKRSGASSDLSVPAKGVLHTTEGGRAGSISVFRNVTGTPTFGAGRAEDGKLHCDQFMPIGEMALTLKNASGGTETNREVRVQIEAYAFSRKTDNPRWFLDVSKKEMDEANKNLIADLVYEASKAASIPLRHVSTPTRSTAIWDAEAGWYGHSEVPENEHWDPGNFDWADCFARGRRVRFHLKWKGGEDKSDVVRGHVARSVYAKFIGKKAMKFSTLALRRKAPRFVKEQVR